MSSPLAVATTLVASSSRWMGGVLGGSIDVDPASRCSDADLPWSTGRAYGGICGTYYFQDIPRRENVPVVFVHGNTADASVWLPMMRSFRERGDTGEDVWAITFRQSSPTHEAMASQLDAFVSRVRDHTGHDAVHVVSHSLGVTGVRYWLATRDRYDWVDSFLGLAGANHGSVRCKHLAKSRLPFAQGAPNWFLNPENLGDPTHPLTRLNQNETPGDVDYFTLRAEEDRFFRENPESPCLDGAPDRCIETTHDGLLTDPEAIQTAYDWLRQ